MEFSITTGGVQFIREYFFFYALQRCQEVDIGGQPVQVLDQIFLCVIVTFPDILRYINAQDRTAHIFEQQTKPLQAGEGGEACACGKTVQRSKLLIFICSSHKSLTVKRTSSKNKEGL